jgi:hypothetical protein
MNHTQILTLLSDYDNGYIILRRICLISTYNNLLSKYLYYRMKDNSSVGKEVFSIHTDGNNQWDTGAPHYMS